ncbi:MAG TPA: UDP-N-acetylmuramate--L-alanine ligase, partial [Armatimonadetes bacterium]|nr:UDP-N-acetylmuramate--L-alanine ligase [Armatimonadota bacterium]
NVNDADIVVVSTAIPHDNPELLEARRRNIPIWHRAEMLGWLMEGTHAIAVAGSHGKSTITGMLGAILETAGCDPTVVIGADAIAYQSNVRIGGGSWMVVEADESDGSFVHLMPRYAIVSNVELDHTNHFPTIGELLDAFVDFLRCLPYDGIAAIGVDCPNARMLLDTVGIRTTTFALRADADYRAAGIEIAPSKSSFCLCYKGEALTQIELNIPGAFNVTNALAAATIAHAIGIEPEAIASGLSSFRGIKRRFEILGKMPDRNVLVVDDYAHHPSEVRAALQTARTFHSKRILTVFQPHRYTRTRALHSEFGPAFAVADMVWVTEIYSAWEQPIAGVSGQLIADAIKAVCPDKPVFFKHDFDAIIEDVRNEVNDDDMVLVLGAGDIYRVAYQLVAE